MLNGDAMMYAASLPKIAIPRRLIDILTSPRYAFYDPSGAGGLWVGKSYGPSASR